MNDPLVVDALDCGSANSLPFIFNRQAVDIDRIEIMTGLRSPKASRIQKSLAFSSEASQGDCSEEWVEFAGHTRCLRGPRREGLDRHSTEKAAVEG